MAAVAAVLAGTGEAHLDVELQKKREEESRKKTYRILMSGTAGPLIKFNCGGELHQIYEETLARAPDTLLSDLVTIPELRQSFAKDDNGVIFFDRHPQAFYEILNYYRTGILVMPPTMMSLAWESELRFFKIDVVRKEKGGEEEDEFKPPPGSKLLGLWLLFEDPGSGRFAKLISMVSLTVIIVSVSCLCAETVYDSECDGPITESDPPHKDRGQHCPNVANDARCCWDKKPPSFFHSTETVCIIWFTAEYLLRLLANKNRLKFVRDTMNLIDLLAIAPFYITLAIGGGGSSFAIVRVIRLVRIFRVFKLGKHSSGLVVLGRTISGSMNELLLLLFFLAMGVLLFATAVYYCEHNRAGEWDDDSPKFESIPHGFWWAIVTMTTLGYGDLYPVTPPGMLVGSACSITGVIMIALPMVVIGQNFADHYSQMRLETQEQEDRARRETEEKEKQQSEAQERPLSLAAADSTMGVDAEAPAGTAAPFEAVSPAEKATRSADSDHAELVGFKVEDGAQNTASGSIADVGVLPGSTGAGEELTPADNQQSAKPQP